MQTFTYKSKNAKGQIVTGQIQARNKNDAKMKILRMRLSVLSIQVIASDRDELDPDETPILGKFIYKDGNGAIQIRLSNDQPKTKDLIIFTKQFATMLDSGVPMIQSLSILGEQQRSPFFRFALKKIQKKVEGGSSLSESLAMFPEIFDSLYTAMISAGETSGHLDTIMAKLVTYIEKAEKIRHQVKKALTYPIAVLCVAVAVITFLLVWVVPIFGKQYTDSGRKLPELTQMVIDFSDLFVAYGPYMGGGLVLAYLYFLSWIKTVRGRLAFDNFILKVPAFGDLLKKVAIGRFCSTMSSMLAAGVNLLEALSICALSSGNKTIEGFILNIRTAIEKGEKFSEPISKGGFFPNIVISMVVVGETTGALDEMLKKISEFFEEEVEQAVEALLALIEPVMMVGIGGIVGFIVIAMYLPVFDMAGGVN
jgi:type IV pilus assembly protein PilC